MQVQLKMKELELEQYRLSKEKEETVSLVLPSVQNKFDVMKYIRWERSYNTAGNRHKQNSWFCKEIREDNFRFWWRRVHEDASPDMYMSKIEICFFTARILQNQRMLCCGECFHD